MNSSEAAAMIREMVSIDPWEHSREGLDDCCHFCGSGAARYEADLGEPHWRSRPRYLHFRRCVWVRALVALGEPLPADHFTVDTKPDWLTVPAWFLMNDSIEAGAIDVKGALS